MQPKFEHIAPQESNDAVEKKYKALSGKEKFEVVLKLFGSEKARDTFIELCKRYGDLRSAATEDVVENYHPIGKRTYSPPKRATLHNEIMDTLKGLALQKLDPLSAKVLYEMADRVTAGTVIKEWSLAVENLDEEEEDEGVRKRGNMSTSAYFHSMGED